MKKFLSMVMAAAMTLSLVPATAFAATYNVDATAKVVSAQNYASGNGTTVTGGPEVWLNINKADYTSDDLTAGITTKFNVLLNDAEFGTDVATIGVYDYSVPQRYDAANVTIDGAAVQVGTSPYKVEVNKVDDDEIEVIITGNTPATDNGAFERNDYIVVGLNGTVMDSDAKGKSASVAVESSSINISNDGTDMTYASVEAKGITASVRKTVDVAVDERVALEDITIKSSVGNMDSVFGSGGNTGELKLKLNSGFEFVDATFQGKDATLEDGKGGSIKLRSTEAGVTIDEDELIIDFTAVGTPLSTSVDTWKIKNLPIDSDSAKSGATATLKLYATGCDTVSAEVAKVVDYVVNMTVDEDVDVPVIYSGVNVNNDGITDDSDHESLTVTVKETFPGAFDYKKEIKFTLPEGVYAVATNPDNAGSDKTTGLDVSGDIFTATNFADAYNEGKYESFVFEKRTGKENQGDEAYEMNFSLTLVADPDFEGDVVLTMEGDAVETQQVTIAKFVKPYTVEAQQNDLQIDYRNTEIPTNIVIKEAEAGLWDKDTVFNFTMEKIDFDDDATFTVDEKSGLTIKDEDTKDGGKDGYDYLTFKVKSTSDDEPATVTISGMSLYMDRSLPAGKYDLNVTSPTMLGSDARTSSTPDFASATGYLGSALIGYETKANGNAFVADVCDYSTTAKEGFVNIITAGREDADSFTTKLVIPIGSTTMTAGENQVTLDAPAYISADGYTMLPLRAVATALGIPNESVLWDGATRTVTIMYGSKVIVMTVGQKTMYLNGSPVPASAAPEITNERTFLPVRDLGTALGVSDLTWDTDPATGKVSTVYVNANK